MLAKRVFRGMVTLIVLTGLLLVGFCLCLVTALVCTAIVSMRLTLSVVSSKLKKHKLKGWS